MWLLLYRERIGVALLVLILGVTMYFGSLGGVSPVITGTVAVPVSTKLMLVKTSKDADGVTTIQHYGPGTETLTLYRAHFGGIRAKPEDLNLRASDGEPVWTIHDEVTYGLVDPELDLGGFVGYARWHGTPSPAHPSSFQPGLRISPFRFLYGTISAPDVLITGDGIGLGLSVYPPASLVGDTWSHAGLGAGRIYGYRGGYANLGYLSFSFVY